MINIKDLTIVQVQEKLAKDWLSSKHLLYDILFNYYQGKIVVFIEDLILYLIS